MKDLPTKIYDLLSNVVKGNMDDYLISVHDPNKKGEGYLGEMCYVSLKDKTSGRTIDFVIKQAFTDEKVRKFICIREFYKGEIYFYTKVWPRFQKIQRDGSLSEPFDKVPRCLTTSLEDGHEKLVFENLKYQDFQIHDKTKPLKDEQFRYIFKQYGKFHAISFADKVLNPDEYQGLIKSIKDLWLVIAEQTQFADHFNYVAQISLESLDAQKDTKAIEKFSPYLGHVKEIFCDKCNYQGEYSVVLHGDCWSNNMMFKYNESKQLTDIRLLDFQCSKVGTPVHDLSYCLYSGGSQETFDKLDDYLRIYHNSLSETLQEFGLNSDNIYPFEALKKDWKEYCQVGFIMGLTLWRGKLTYQDSIKDLTDLSDNEESFMNTKYDVEKFNTISRSLVLHMAENDFL